jgi:hypothetical protein
MYVTSMYFNRESLRLVTSLFGSQTRGTPGHDPDGLCYGGGFGQEKFKFIDDYDLVVKPQSQITVIIT